MNNSLAAAAAVLGTALVGGITEAIIKPLAKRWVQRRIFGGN